MGALLLILFLLMQQRVGPTSSDATPDHTSGDAPPKGGGLPGLLADVLPGVIGLLGGGGGAAGAGGGGAAGGAGAGAGAGAGGGTPAGVVGGTTVGLGGSSVLGPVMVGLLANPAAWAIYILIASKVVQAQENDKDFQSQLFALNCSARALHDFEQAATKQILKTRGLVELPEDVLPQQVGKPLNSIYRVHQQRDQRLDQPRLGSRVTLQGWRSTYKFPWQPGDETLFRKVRYLALEYLKLRAGHGYRMLRYWKPEVSAPAGMGDGLTEHVLHRMYETPGMPGNMPDVGGLLHIPLAAEGVTRTLRRNNDVYPNDPLQLRPPPYEAEPVNEVVASDLQMVRLAALLDAVHVVRWDPRPIIDLDAQRYAEDVSNALGSVRYASDGKLMTSRTPLEGLSCRNGFLFLDPAVFGTVADEQGVSRAIAVDPQAIRQTDFGNTRRKVVLV